MRPALDMPPSDLVGPLYFREGADTYSEGPRETQEGIFLASGGLVGYRGAWRGPGAKEGPSVASGETPPARLSGMRRKLLLVAIAVALFMPLAPPAQSSIWAVCQHPTAGIHHRASGIYHSILWYNAAGWRWMEEYLFNRVPIRNQWGAIIGYTYVHFDSVVRKCYPSVT